MTLPAGKLRILIPKLASNFDGEVVATARAIDRTLKGANADWHDLANSITAQPPIVRASVPPHRGYGPCPEQPPGWDDRALRWSELDPSDRVTALDAIAALKLTAWERGFVHSIQDSLRQHRSHRVSEKQADILNRLLVRVWREDREEDGA